MESFVLWSPTQTTWLDEIAAESFEKQFYQKASNLINKLFLEGLQ
jgi:hypothetical protein